MKIRTKLIFNYSILSFILLLVFSFIVVFFYSKYRDGDFETRLKNRSMSSVNMLLQEHMIDSTMLSLIDRNIVTAMTNLRLEVYEDTNKLIYSNSQVSNTSNIRHFDSEFSRLVNILYKGEKTIKYNLPYNNKNHLVIASAIDNQGISELQNLVHILLWVLGLSLLFIIGFGFYNANWSLKPFREVIKEVEAIEPTELKKRLSVNGTDEISQLSQKMNVLLERISQAFETEKSFIANASHELRTPVTSVLGQIEVALNKDRPESEYKSILQSVYEDTTQMANIINGFLDLADANLANNKVNLTEIAIDDLIFSILNDFKKRKPHYNISVELLSNPAIDNQLQCLGNERLLYLMFSNLIDNACKYSEDKRAKVKIDFVSNEIIVSVIDFGIGIHKDDLENIFKPLFRGKNVSGKPGHGIGLAVVRRIAELHNAKLIIDSELNIGTNVVVKIKSV